MEEQKKKIIRLIEEKTGSKTFCVLPWIHIATRPNGDSRLCCVTNASGAKTGEYDVGLIKKENGSPANFGKDNLLDAWNGDYMRSVRKTMLEGNIPASCFKCFEEESNGVVSKRLWEHYEWNKKGLDLEKLILETDEDGSVPYKIKYLDLRLGHTCNLKCIMCSPHDSSRWTQDYDQLMSKTRSTIILSQTSWNKEEFNNRWYEKPEFWSDIYDQIPNIEEIYFAGGEPLMIKEHKKFLLEIVERGYSKNIQLRYNSNGTLIDQDMIKLWQNFGQVRFAFSIDAVGDKNFYIRYPADWSEIERSLRLLDDTTDNIQISIACAVQIFNIKHIIDFAKWKLSQGFKKINNHSIDEYVMGGGIINLHLLYIPTFLSARILPYSEKNKIRKQFEEFKDWLWNNYTKDDNFWKDNPYGWARWEGILKFIEAEDHSYLIPDFKEYVNNLDGIRNLNALDYFPELESLLV